MGDRGPVMELIRRVVPMMVAAGNLQWDEQYPNHQVFTSDIELAQLWVAEQAGLLVGVAAITAVQPPEYAQIGWDIHEPVIVPHRLAVDPAARGAGIASALLRQAEVVARQQGIMIVRVDTGVQNRAAQRLYAKLGYTQAGEINLNYRAGLRVVCYQKHLAPEAM